MRFLLQVLCAPYGVREQAGEAAHEEGDHREGDGEEGGEARPARHHRLHPVVVHLDLADRDAHRHDDAAVHQGGQPLADGAMHEDRNAAVHCKRNAATYKICSDL